MEGSGSWSWICDREESINKDIVIYSGEFTTLFFIAYKQILRRNRYEQIKEIFISN